MTANDLELLRQFARDQSQDAFTALVNRHVNLVYSAALRQVRSPQLAEEIVQSVFADLARDAGKVSSTGFQPVNSLMPWLYAVTRRTAIDVIRKESRRQLREQIAVEMNNMNQESYLSKYERNFGWPEIEPFLDDAVAALDETDRAAILLRYFENKNLREVGESLKISDDAAQKRVSRAVERLREFFSKRNVTIGASGLAVLISANAVQSAPVGLAAIISAAAILTGTAVHTSTVIAATKTIAVTTLQKTFFAATLTAAIGTGIYEAHQNSQSHELVQTLQQQQAPLAEQIQHLQSERDKDTNTIVWLKEELARNEKNNMELLKLRGEVSLLKNQTTGQSVNANESWRNPAVVTNTRASLNMLNTNAPQVRLLNSIYDRNRGGFAEGDYTQFDRFHNVISRSTQGWRGIGLGFDARELLESVYEFDRKETIYPTNMPAGRFDIIANLSQGSQVALQEEIRNRLGITATKMEVSTNAYALVLHDPDSPIYHETNMMAGVKIKYWVNVLEGLYHAPVVNLAGLTNYYACDCNFYRPMRQTDDEFKPIVLARIREQLGFELIATNLPIEMLVVEKAN